MVGVGYGRVHHQAPVHHAAESLAEGWRAVGTALRSRKHIDSERRSAEGVEQRGERRIGPEADNESVVAIDASRLASRCKHPVAVEARGGARRNGPWQAQYCRVGREPMLSKLFEASPRARKGAALWAQPWQHNPREEHQANGHESTLKAESHVGAWHGSQRQINE
eukprot:scaffold57802_cov92-Phaeocystis_antarctica.AAC.1